MADVERGPVWSAWTSVFESEDLAAQPAEELSGFRLGFTGDNGKVLCFVMVDEERELTVVYALAPLVVPAERRDAVARYLCRVGFGLPVGAFELDLDDGEVRFRTSVALGAEPPDPRAFSRALWSAVAALDQYLPGLVAVAQQQVDPDAAAAEAAELAPGPG